MWRWASRETATEIAKEGIKYILPLAIPSGVGLMGWLQDVPWFYVSVGVILSGAGIMTWLVQFDEWKSRNRVEHKLVFGNMRMSAKRTEGEKARITSIQFGFLLRNRASFPVTFQVENIQTKLNLQGIGEPIYPPNKPYQKKTVAIAPDGVGWFDDHDIILPNGFQGNAKAEIQCSLSYGRAGRLDYGIKLDKNTGLNFHGTEVKGGETWYEQ